MTEALRLWFLLLFGVGIAGFLATALRFRGRRAMVERMSGPVPTPIPLVAQSVALLILLTRTGELSSGWPLLRVLGLGLSLYAVVMLPWALRTLGRFFVPGVAVFRDHALVTSGPFRLVRHPLYSAVLALWLGAALGTLNWLLFALLPLVVAGLFIASGAEEAMLRAKFGTSYEAYAAQTGRFIPKVWGRQQPVRG
jgi:protein-S-isoprenylcysteine O-methyltransferase Ste14